ncbi:hypothetical protein Taro_006595 [Colocasia esculenta]|uniref:CCHC-type domain-containing protein n=1 Tax=Colocasia esculenta TaxID=4460 RepID=A0A843TT68_COLES|nr:hypothetical protein [Colocasia esculenta]
MERLGESSSRKKHSNALKVEEDRSEEDESSSSCEDEEAMLSRRLQSILAKKKKFQSGRRHFKKNKDFKKPDGKDQKKGEPICYECKKPGHIKAECPKFKKPEFRKKESSKKFRRHKKKAMVVAWSNSSDSNSESSSSSDEEEANLAFMANTEEKVPVGLPGSSCLLMMEDVAWDCYDRSWAVATTRRQLPFRVSSSSSYPHQTAHPAMAGDHRSLLTAPLLPESALPCGEDVVAAAADVILDIRDGVGNGNGHSGGVEGEVGQGVAGGGEDGNPFDFLGAVPLRQPRPRCPVDPFRNHTPRVEGIYECCKIVLCLPIALARLVLFGLAIVVGFLVTLLALQGWKDKQSPMPRWRSGVMWVTRLCARCILFSFGYHWIKRRGKPASRKIAPIVVSNHVSYIEPIFFFYELFPSIVASESHDSIPFVGTIVRAMQVIYVDRFSAPSRKNAVNEIKV